MDSGQTQNIQTLTNQSTMDALDSGEVWTDSGQSWKDSGQTQNIQTLTNQDARQQRSFQDSMDLERVENGQQARHKGGCLKIGYQDKATRWFIK